MHYKNGREAKVGDHVVGRSYSGPSSGVVVSAQAGSDTCNLQVLPVTPANLVCMTAKECLHIDDALPVDPPKS